MSEFTKIFVTALIVQASILMILAIAFFAGGPETNSVRFLIGIVGMGLFAILDQIGINSNQSIVVFTLTLMFGLALLAASLSSKSSVHTSDAENAQSS